MAQQYSTSILRSLWCNFLGQSKEFSGCPPPGAWAQPLFFGKPIGGVPATLLPAYKALEMALLDAGYGPPQEGQSVWAYNKRPIAGTSSWSLHSYGIAIDIDPLHNPMKPGDPYSGWMKKSHVDSVMKIKTKTGRGLWYWGGYWSSRDRMHYQIDNRPADVAVDWSTVPGWEDDEMQDADWDKLTKIVREQINQEFNERLKMNDAKTNAISRGVWAHKGETSGGVPHEKSMGTMQRGTYNKVTDEK